MSLALKERCSSTSGSGHLDLYSILVFCPRLHFFCSFLCPVCHPLICLWTLLSISHSFLHSQIPIVGGVRHPNKVRYRLLFTGLLRDKHLMDLPHKPTHSHLVASMFSRRGRYLVNVRQVQHVLNCSACSN